MWASGALSFSTDTINLNELNHMHLSPNISYRVNVSRLEDTVERLRQYVMDHTMLRQHQRQVVEYLHSTIGKHMHITHGLVEQAIASRDDRHDTNPTQP